MTTHASDFPDEWGRVKKGCKGLSRFTNVISNRFEDRLRGILENLEKFITIKEAEEGQGNVQALLRSFAATVRADIEGVKAARRLMKRLKEAENEFKRLRSELKDYEARAYEACGRYFERRQEYVRARERILERAQASLEEIKGDFLERAEQIAEGYDIVYSGASLHPEDLFEELVNEGMGRVEIRLKERTHPGVSEEEVLAKREVLDYLIRETRTRLLPVIRYREEGVREVEALFPELRSLEKECTEAEMLREQAMKPLEELRKEIVDIRRSGAFAYTTDEKLLEIRASYQRKIEEIEDILE